MDKVKNDTAGSKDYREDGEYPHGHDPGDIRENITEMSHRIEENTGGNTGLSKRDRPSTHPSH
jgi:hypothetical protein